MRNKVFVHAVLRKVVFNQDGFEALNVHQVVSHSLCEEIGGVFHDLGKFLHREN